jgi:ferrous iron transport protein A
MTVFHDHRTEQPMPLSLVGTGQPVQVLEISSNPKVTHRLHDMGIVRGARLTIVQDDGRSLLLAIGDTRLGLGRGVAQQVRVLLEKEPNR